MLAPEEDESDGGESGEESHGRHGGVRLTGPRGWEVAAVFTGVESQVLAIIRDPFRATAPWQQ